MGSAALVVALLLTGPIVTFEWTEPDAGVAPDYYEVELSQKDRDPELMTTPEPSISLAPELGRDFEVRVRACTGLVCGMWSELSQPISLNRTSDFNDDGIVGVPDYREFVRMIGDQGPEADLNGDTVVGIPDFSEFAEHFGTCVGNVAIGGEEVPAYAPCRRQRRGR